MAAKDVKFSTDARDKFLRGVDILANAVKVTLGPKRPQRGARQGWGAPTGHQRRRHRRQGDRADDPYENLGAQLLVEAASKTNDVAGDGTTTATVLAEAISEGSRWSPPALTRWPSTAASTKAVEAGHRGLNAPVKTHREAMRDRPDRHDCGNNDPEIGKVIAEAS